MAKKKQSEEEIAFDIKKFTNIATWVNNNKALLLMLVLILVPMILSIHFRVQSAYLPVTEDWARSSVYNGVRNSISSEVNQRYPNLPDQNKEELVNQQFERLLKEQESVINQQIQGGAQHFKSRLQNEDGQTYLLAIDPYQWYRRIENKVETGVVHDELKEGVPWNTHMYAPLGQKVGPAFHISVSYYMYRLVGIFNSGIPLMTVFFFIPVIFAALSVIPAFFLARKKAGNLGGFIAATILAVHTSFIGRTAAGFSDTDAYNVFFPLLITWLFLEAFESDTLKNRILFTSLAGLCIGLFSFAWNGWWYIFDFLIVVLGAYAGYSILRQVIRHKLDLKKILTSEQVVNTIVIGVLFIVASGIFATFFTSWTNFSNAPLEPIKFSIIKNAAKPTLWPNVFTTVAELGNTGLGTIVNSMGGKLMFFLASLGLVLTMTGGQRTWKRDSVLIGASSVLFLLLVSNSFLAMGQIKYLMVMALPLAIGLILTLKDDEEVDVKYALFLTVWFMGTIYASTKGVRFLLLLVPAFAVAFGISLGMIKDILARWVRTGLNIDSDKIIPLITILLLLFLIGPIKAAGRVGINEVPSMNDAWWESLEQIRYNSEPDAVVNSWWDFGHWFKAIADRAVTFDGASQNTPMAHWVGNALLTNNEKEAVGILRMLDCGSNNAFNTLDEQFQDTVVSVALLYEVIVMDKESARTRLQEAGVLDIETVLSYTHCEPPENFFITSEDMVGKAGVWAHFGSWNFERAYIYTNLRNAPPDQAIAEMKNKFGYTEDQATKTYYDVISLRSENDANAWISPWPNYVTGRWIGCPKPENDVFSCNLRLGVNNQGNQQIVLETVTINLKNPSETNISFGGYDRTTGVRVGSGGGQAQEVTIASEDGLETYNLKGTTFPYTILVDLVSGPRVLVVHPLFKDALFTKLFYLDGRYTEHFDKFSDKTAINGQRIIVWKVDWDGK